jgi:hypothetical protein
MFCVHDAQAAWFPKRHYPHSIIVVQRQFDFGTDRVLLSTIEAGCLPRQFQIEFPILH